MTALQNSLPRTLDWATNSSPDESKGTPIVEVVDLLQPDALGIGTEAVELEQVRHLHLHWQDRQKFVHQGTVRSADTGLHYEGKSLARTHARVRATCARAKALSVCLPACLPVCLPACLPAPLSPSLPPHLSLSHSLSHSLSLSLTDKHNTCHFERLVPFRREGIPELDLAPNP